MKTETVCNNFSEGDIALIQDLINDAQPNNEVEEAMRTTIQFLYRRNPAGFYKYLKQTKMPHLVLWTESKKISSHFKLSNLIYIYWNGSSYECSKHNNFGQPATTRFRNAPKLSLSAFDKEIEGFSPNAV
jgi:hypothetical protein